jgi:hypothetical protein
MAGQDATRLGHDVGSVITDFLEEADEGRRHDAQRVRHARDEVRALRAALSHVASDELGERDVDAVSDADIRALVSRLRDAGLPPGRVEAVLDALGSLYAYAIRRGMVARSPLAEATPAADTDDDGPTPTSPMLTVIEHAVTWSVRLIVVCALLLFVALVIALG